MAVFSKVRSVAFVTALILSTTTTVVALPTNKASYDIDLDGFVSTLEARGVTDFVNFAGITGGLGPADGQVPVRQEFRKFAQDPVALNLYVLALDRMQSTPQTNSTSFYQLGGIHGRPYQAWDSVQGSGGNKQSGYCTHADILFPTWHRPYLALYEQTLWNHVQKIASEFTPGSAASQKYLAAAPGWRMPYWDWAVNAQIPDQIANQVTISVEKPAGTSNIKNPLYSYKFNPLNPSDLPDQPYNVMKETYRNPSSNDGVNFVSQPADLNAQLSNIAVNLRTRTYTLLTAYRDYLSFSNKGTTTSVNGQFDSLESIHDTIHATVGGNGGHMGAVDYAAMDPLFYLHHANVDRIFAIWQAINPSSYVTTGTSGRATFASAAGMSENANTPLMPFHKTDSEYYTSSTAAYVKNFGYTYPELVDWTTGSLLSTAAIRTNVIAQVNALYGSSQPGNILSSAASIAATSTSTTIKATPTSTKVATTAPVVVPTTLVRVATTTPVRAATTTAAAKPVATTAKSTPAPTPTPWWNTWNPWSRWGWKVKRDLSVAPPATSSFSSTAVTAAVPTSTSATSATTSGNVDAVPPVTAVASSIPKLVQHNYYQEYLVDISVGNAAGNGTFAIYVFLGDFNSDASKWALDKNLVGTHGVFATANGGHNTLVAGSIPLTASLINKVVSGSLASLNTTSVVPYLATNLHWGVKGSDGTVINNSDVNDLQIQVVSAQVQLPDSPSDLPVWGPYVTQYKATTNKAAGVTSGETLGKTT